MYMKKTLGLKSTRSNKTISPHTRLCYSNLKNMFRLYETNIIRLQVSEIYHHHKHQGLDPLIRSVPRVTVALSNVSSVSLLSFFLVVCSGMISRGFGFVAFFASVKTSLVCINLSCLLCM